MATTCCYENCNRSATDHDADGDEACELHAAQSEEWVILTNLTNGNWIDEDGAKRVEEILSDDGWDVEIRSPRQDECGDSTYYRKGDGTLQIVGHSIPEPEALQDAVRKAWDKAMST